MDQDDISRFSRQLIMPEIGMKGQLKLKSSSVLIIGAGGLGCPVIQYLTAAGVGKLGIVDHDIVDSSNLHRQVIHTEHGARDGLHKVTSACQFARSLNSHVEVVEIKKSLNQENAFHTVSAFDVVIDATDNVISRYVISDACVLADKPLVSGSALRWEGQVTVYHYKNITTSEYGPCYRCLYPKPPPPETVTNCSDGGVIGVVPGIIGSIQALETIKILLGISPAYDSKLLVFDGLSCSFRSIRLRKRQLQCPVCGDKPSITMDNLPNYEVFCGSTATDKCMTLNILKPNERITAVEYKHSILDSRLPHVLLDVRQPVELDICALPHAINFPIKSIERVSALFDLNSGSEEKIFSDKNLSSALDAIKKAKEMLPSDTTGVNVFVVCRLGNDSQKAVKMLIKTGVLSLNSSVIIKDIKGGLFSWTQHIDSSFPTY